jgi:hypothetical protein
MRVAIVVLVATALAVTACAKKGGEALADAIVDCLLPCDVTATDAAEALTPTDAVASPDAVTP